MIDKNKVQVHNIGEERSVGFFNHEISICGKRNVDPASRKMALNKSHGIMGSPKSFKTFLQSAKEIKVLNAKWNDRMAEPQTKCYTEKEVLNLRPEAQKLNENKFLKS